MLPAVPAFRPGAAAHPSRHPGPCDQGAGEPPPPPPEGCSAFL